MRNEIYPTGGRLSAAEVGKEDDAGLINIPNSAVHPDQKNAGMPNMAQVHKVKINGNEKEVTTQQLIDMAQKAESADEKFQAAAALSRENADAINMQADVKALFEDGDMDAFRRLGLKMGVDPADVERITQETFNSEESDEDVIETYEKELRENPASKPQKTGPIDYSQLSPDIQRALRTVETDRIEKIVTAALDNDEVVTYNMEQYDATGQAAIRAFVDDKVRGRLDAFGGDFGDGSRILADILPEVRDHLQALGRPRQTGPMGLGHAPGGGDMEVYPKTKPEHVSSTEGEAFEQNILETLAWEQAKAERNSS